MKRALSVVTLTVAVLTVLLYGDRDRRWSLDARLPLTPWQESARLRCSAPTRATLRKVLWQDLDTDCPPSWWAPQRADPQAAEVSAWALRAARTLRGRESLRAAWMSVSRGHAPEPHAWALARSAPDDPIARALLRQGRLAWPDALDPAASASADAWLWLDGQGPLDSARLLLHAGHGWIVVPGLGALASEALVGGPVDDGARGRDPTTVELTPAPPQACAEDPEAPACLAALSAFDRPPPRAATVPPTARAWAEFAGVPPDDLADWLAVWGAWAGERDAAELLDVLTLRLDAASEPSGVAAPSPLAWQGPASAGTWTSLLGILWVLQAADRSPVLSREGAAVRLAVDDALVQWRLCAEQPGPSAATLTDRALLIAAVHERAEAEPRWRSLGRRLEGAQPSAAPGPAGLAARMLFDDAPGKTPGPICGGE